MADLKISELASANVVNKDDLFYLIQDLDSKNVKASTLFASIIDPTLAGNILLGGEVQTLNAAGTVSITSTRTDLIGGLPANSDAVANGSILPSAIFLYTEGVPASGKGFTFVDGTPATQTLYASYKNNKIYLSKIQSTTSTYPPENWVGSGSKPFSEGLTFVKDSRYIFDVSDPSNAGNVLALSTSLDGTNTLGSRYIAAVTHNGTPGTPGANVVFTVPNVTIDTGGYAFLNLPNASEGQLKLVNLSSTDGGKFVLASNIQNNIAIELRNAGDSAILMYSGNTWTILGASPGLVTPFSGTADDVPANEKRYFTNARARAAITPADSTIIYDAATGTIAANVEFLSNIDVSGLISSSDMITEGNAKLFYSNDRVLSNVSKLSIDVFADVNTTTRTPNVGYALVWNGTTWEPNAIIVPDVSTANVANTVLSISNFTTANLVEGTNLYYTNARVYANVAPLLSLKANVVDLTTSNVAELDNLYYTNARVYSNVAPLLDLKANVVDLTTSNVAELNNLYYTNARVYSNVIGLLNNKANVVDLTTANVAETTNLYYTNARVKSALEAGTGVLYDKTTGTISIGQNVDAHADVTFNKVTVSGNLNVLGNVVGVYSNTLIVTDPLIQLGYGNPSDGLDIGFVGHYNDGTERHAGIFRDASAQTFKIFDNYTGEPGASTIDVSDVSFRLANIQATTFIGNVTGTVGSISNFTTANLVEGINLYYTNARVYANVIPLLNLKANVSDLTTSNVAEGTNLYFTNARVLSALTSTAVNTSNVTASTVTTNNIVASNVTVTNILTARSNVGLSLGTATQGSLVSNAITMTVDTTVTNGIAQLNEILGKLVPASPTTFPGNGYVTINSLSTYRMANFVQTDNTSSGRTVGPANVVSVVRRVNSYTTTTINDMGPGNTGTVTLYKNGSAAGSKTLASGSDNGTYTELVIGDNVDYATKTGAAGGFWESFDANASGTVSAGWNEVYFTHSQGGASNVAYWYYDSSNPGAVVFSVPTIYPTSNTYANSSTVPHYTSSTVFTMTANVKNLSGDMYPTSNTFITGSSATGFGTPSSLNYESAGVTGVPLPLTQNLYVSGGNAQISTTVNISSGFGSTSTAPSLTGINSYSNGTGTFTLGATILYKTPTISSLTTMEESNIFVQSNVGSGSGYGARIINPGSSDNPTQSAGATLFDSNVGTLLSYDATIVAANCKHDQTNYSVGYLPVGPNLSSGRSGAQYFTFKFARTSVSKFNIQFTGQVAGMWVALPGSSIDTTASPTNGWLSMSTAAITSGIPGTGAGGNGSAGCALGGTVTLNSQGTQSKTCTFGTVSSSSTATNEIYVRIKLTSGQGITALAILGASN